MRIEIICTGDEILSGRTVNTNYGYIARRLYEVGLGVHWGTTVGDELDDLLAAFQQAAARSDAAIVNGGLGPTSDDLSQEAAARAAGLELELNEAWLLRIEEHYRRRNRTMPLSNRKQAMLPAGAQSIDNRIGTACGFALAIGRAKFFFTPGIPREMELMLNEHIIPRLLTLSGENAPTPTKRFHVFGISESRAAELLQDVEALASESKVKLGFQSRFPQLEIKLTARGADALAVARDFETLELEVRRRLGNFVVAEDDQTLEEVILGALRSRGDSLSTAEMFTGGNVAARLVSTVGGKEVYRRGITACTLDHLWDAIGDSATLAISKITVQSSDAIAVALRQATQSSYALTVLTEIDNGTHEDLYATVCMSIAGRDQVVSRTARMTGSPDWIRIAATELALDCLRRYLLGVPLHESIDYEIS